MDPEIAALFCGESLFILLLIIAQYRAIKSELDEIWNDTDKIKRRLKKIGKSRSSNSDCGEV